MTVLCEQTSRNVIVLVFTVQQQQVSECFWRIRRVRQQIGKFLERSCGVVVSMYQGLKKRNNDKPSRITQQKYSVDPKHKDGCILGCEESQGLVQTRFGEAYLSTHRKLPLLL